MWEAGVSEAGTGRAMAPSAQERNSLAARAAAGGLTAIGCISGTSMDGIDVAVIQTDGERRITRGQNHTVPYSEAAKSALREAMADARHVSTAHERTPAMARAEALVTREHTAAIAALSATADVVGWHGQTVFHAPGRRLTVQLGDGEAMAADLGLPVIVDMRQADVAAGGQGAPLVPIYHAALVRAAALPEPAMVINLGGVANITFIDGDTLLSCDTGPASALIDDAVAERGAKFDAGGAIAASGSVDAKALAALLSHPYFAAPLPKSLDRDAFDPAPVAHLAFEDRIATLTAFSAASLGRIIAHLPARPATVIASGGGTHNHTLMAMISDALETPVRTADSLGWSSDAMEAEAFAYLAVRAIRDLPLTFPGTTGAPEPLTGGRFASP